jgi:hypothetical protein
MQLSKADYNRNDFWEILARAKVHGLAEEPSSLITFGERVPDEKIIQALKCFSVTIVEGNQKNVELLRAALPNLSICHSLIQDYAFDKDYDICWWYHGPEHLPKEIALTVIRSMQAHCNMVILSMPHGNYPQGEYLGNPLEKHVSTFYPSDFEEFGDDAWAYFESEHGDDFSSIDVFIKGLKPKIGCQTMGGQAIIGASALISDLKGAL